MEVRPRPSLLTSRQPGAPLRRTTPPNQQNPVGVRGDFARIMPVATKSSRRQQSHASITSFFSSVKYAG
jgi:hypothetical protein